MNAAFEDLRLALAAFDEQYHRRMSAQNHVPHAPLKQMVLAVVPDAKVRRRARDCYECFIGDRSIRITTRNPVHAWLGLARHVSQNCRAAAALEKENA
jgi:hypothetical protein